MELSDCINYLLTNAQNAVHLHFKAQLQPFDVTPAQYMVLNLLGREGRLSPSRLAQLCRLDASTMTGILTRMEKKDLIERKHCAGDRRVVDIDISEAGASLLPSIAGVIERSNQEALACLSADEQSSLKRCLSRIIAAYE